MWPTWGPPGSYRPQMAPCWPHEPCYQGSYDTFVQYHTRNLFTKYLKVSQALEFFNRSQILLVSWWRHQMETFSALLAICAGNSLVTCELPAQRPVTRSFDVFFDLRLNKRLGKTSWGWWFETPTRPLWRRCNVLAVLLPRNLLNFTLMLNLVGSRFCQVLQQYVMPLSKRSHGHWKKAFNSTETSFMEFSSW